MFHRALIINLTVTEAILSALVLDALLSQLVMVADVCKAPYIACKVLTLSPGTGKPIIQAYVLLGLPRSHLLLIALRSECHHPPLQRRKPRFLLCKGTCDLQRQGGAYPPVAAAHWGQSCLGLEELREVRQGNCI